MRSDFSLKTLVKSGTNAWYKKHWYKTIYWWALTEVKAMHVVEPRRSVVAPEETEVVAVHDGHVTETRHRRSPRRFHFFPRARFCKARHNTVENRGQNFMGGEEGGRLVLALRLRFKVHARVFVKNIAALLYRQEWVYI